MQSKNTIYEKDTENTPTRKTGEITNLEFSGIETTFKTGNIYTYQTGRFPVTSIKGTEEVFVLYCYDTNEIITEPHKYRAEK